MIYKNSYAVKIKEYIKEEKFTYYIETMGCSMNENDSAKYAGIMEDMGMSKAYKIEEANVILFNTCCIRENAEDKLYGRLGVVKKLKEKNKKVYCAVVGCMSQQEHVLEKIKKSYSFVDVVLGTYSMGDFSEKLYKSISDNKKTIEHIEISNDILEEVPIVYESPSKASISIIYGCNNFCSYCIVPYVRGRERSRSMENILKDANVLAKTGYKEITLLGQNVNTYGKDLKDGSSFSKLLRKLNEIEGLEVIRFMSPHPKDFTDDVILAIKECKKVARQIHLPLQSGSTNILEKMNRKYTKQNFLELAKKLQDEIPDVSLSTDIILGFPGEEEQDFLDTLDVVKKVRFDQIYMFEYSRRKGTKADLMENQIDDKIKNERLIRLKELYKELVEEKNKELIGNTYGILVEGKSKTNDKLYTGRTSQNKILVFEASIEDIGTIKNIKVTSQHLWYLKGKIV